MYADRLEKDERFEPTPEAALTPLATVNQRTPRTAPGEEGVTATSRRPSRRGAGIGAAVAAAVAVAAAMAVLLSGRKTAAPAIAVQAAPVHEEAPAVHAVTIHTDPEDSDIYEGARRIGRSPRVWAGAAEGEHELTLRHDGYREEKGKLVVRKDGEEFSFRLHRLEPVKKGPDLRIKAER